MKPICYKDVYDFQNVTIKLSEGEFYGSFSSLRIDRKSLPHGYYAYDIRHDEGSWFAELKDCVLVNHFGTFVTRTEIPDAEKGHKIVDVL